MFTGCYAKTALGKILMGKKKATWERKVRQYLLIWCCQIRQRSRKTSLIYSPVHESSVFGSLYL